MLMEVKELINSHKITEKQAKLVLELRVFAKKMFFDSRSLELDMIKCFKEDIPITLEEFTNKVQTTNTCSVFTEIKKWRREWNQ